MNGIEKPCPRLNDGDIEDDSSDNDYNSNSIVKIDFARPYLIDTIRITHSENGAKSEWISVAFSDGSSERVRHSCRIVSTVNGLVTH